MHKLDGCWEDTNLPLCSVQASSKNDVASVIALEPAIRFNGGGHAQLPHECPATLRARSAFAELIEKLVSD